MDRSSTTGSGASADLLVDIIETLEAYGVNRDEYQLYDSIDVEALEQILNSSTKYLPNRRMTSSQPPR